MTSPRLLVPLIILLQVPLLAQTGFNGTFLSSVNGISTTLSLRQSGATVAGDLVEGEYDLTVRGTVSGMAASGTLNEKSLNLAVAEFKALLRGNNSIELTLTVDGQTSTVTFLRQGMATETVALPSDHRRRDERIVGTWSHQVITKGGDAGFSTVLYFDIVADGRYGQYSKSTGGGADWSYTSGGPELLQQGRWYTDEGVLYLLPEGKRDYIVSVQYKFLEGQLVTDDTHGRKIWERE